MVLQEQDVGHLQAVDSDNGGMQISSMSTTQSLDVMSSTAAGQPAPSCMHGTGDRQQWWHSDDTHAPVHYTTTAAQQAQCTH